MGALCSGESLSSLSSYLIRVTIWVIFSKFLSTTDLFFFPFLLNFCWIKPLFRILPSNMKFLGIMTPRKYGQFHVDISDIVDSSKLHSSRDYLRDMRKYQYASIYLLLALSLTFHIFIISYYDLMTCIFTYLIQLALSLIHLYIYTRYHFIKIC